MKQQNQKFLWYFGLPIVGLSIALAAGSAAFALLGLLIVAVGITLSTRGIWIGVQQTTQTHLAVSIVAMLFGLAAFVTIVGCRLWAWISSLL